MSITINSDGRITLPDQLRDRPGWQPGNKLVLDANEKGELILRAERIVKNADPDRFNQAIGILPPYPGGTDAYMEFLRGED
jgi:AbrB family looped-hinge helix DNA binding protein